MEASYEKRGGQKDSHFQEQKGNLLRKIDSCMLMDVYHVSHVLLQQASFTLSEANQGAEESWKTEIPQRN